MTPIFLWLQNSWKSQFLNHFLTTCIWGMCSAEWQLLRHLNKTSLAIMLEVGWGRASERIFGLFFQLTYFAYSTNFSTIPLQSVFVQGPEQNTERSYERINSVFSYFLPLSLREIEWFEVCSWSVILIGKTNPLLNILTHPIKTLFLGVWGKPQMLHNRGNP